MQYYPESDLYSDSGIWKPDHQDPVSCLGFVVLGASELLALRIGLL